MYLIRVLQTNCLNIKSSDIQNVVPIYPCAHITLQVLYTQVHLEMYSSSYFT